VVVRTKVSRDVPLARRRIRDGAGVAPLPGHTVDESRGVPGRGRVEDPGREGSPPSSVSEAVASFATYAQAARAVDFLADRRLPVRDMAIVVRDFRVERGSGPSATYVTAGAAGAVSGAATGALVVLLLGASSMIVPPGPGVLVACASGGLGAIVGTVVAVVDHALSRDARRAGAVRSLAAWRYDVVTTPAMASTARRLLGELGQRSAA
jgi:hypothetical protein